MVSKIYYFLFKKKPSIEIMNKLVFTYRLCNLHLENIFALIFLNIGLVQKMKIKLNRGIMVIKHQPVF